MATSVYMLEQRVSTACQAQQTPSLVSTTISDADTHSRHQQQKQHQRQHHLWQRLTASLTQTVLLSREVSVWIMQEYTDDTAELRKQLDALGGMAALQDPEKQLLALQDLEQFVSAVCHLCSAVHLVDACLKCAT